MGGGSVVLVVVVVVVVDVVEVARSKFDLRIDLKHSKCLIKTVNNIKIFCAVLL